MTVTALMMPAVSPPHWTDLALCEGDKRFTQDEKLSAKDRKQMESICRECEVFFECLEHHDPPDEVWHATGVFAAGEYFEEDVMDE